MRTAKSNKMTAREEEILERKRAAAAKARAQLAKNRAARKEAVRLQEELERMTRVTKVNRKVTRRDVLAKADEIVNGDRNTKYGEPENNFAMISSLWSNYLGITVKPHDVAALMMLMKVARIKTSPGQQDHWVDIAGYASCGFTTVPNE